MTPETGYFLDKARRLLNDADAMLAISLFDAAGRTAYLAGFHAAQAFISDKTAKTVKTHQGVHSEWGRLTRNDPAFQPEMRGFLSRTYNLKAVADYDTGPGAEVSPERARTETAAAKRFVALIEGLLAGS